jgi:hypothetical protein
VDLKFVASEKGVAVAILVGFGVKTKVTVVGHGRERSLTGRMGTMRENGCFDMEEHLALGVSLRMMDL